MRKLLLPTLTAFLFLSRLDAQISLSFDTVRPSAGSCNGSITASVNNPSSDEQYIWSNGATTATITNLCSDIYCVTVTDPVRCSNGQPCVATGCIDFRSHAKPCSITSSPNGDIAATGGNVNNIYLGYGPQSTTLNVSAPLTGNYTYAWSPSTGLSCTTCASPVFTPTAQGIYTFTAVVTDAVSLKPIPSCSITICVMDIRATGNDARNGNKVYVCHLPPGNPANVQTICISVNAVPAHVPLHGGDHLGRCDQVCGSSKTDDESAPEMIPDALGAGMDILLYPNPFNNHFKLQLESESNSSYSVKLFDISGRLVEEQNELSSSSTANMGDNLNSGVYFAQVKQNNNTRIIRITKSE